MILALILVFIFGLIVGFIAFYVISDIYGIDADDLYTLSLPIIAIIILIGIGLLLGYLIF